MKEIRQKISLISFFFLHLYTIARHPILPVFVSKFALVSNKKTWIPKLLLWVRQSNSTSLCLSFSFFADEMEEEAGDYIGSYSSSGPFSYSQFDMCVCVCSGHTFRTRLPIEIPTKPYIYHMRNEILDNNKSAAKQAHKRPFVGRMSWFGVQSELKASNKGIYQSKSTEEGIETNHKTVQKQWNELHDNETKIMEPKKAKWYRSTIWLATICECCELFLNRAAFRL